jgi:hypothetical protein
MSDWVTQKKLELTDEEAMAEFLHKVRGAPYLLVEGKDDESLLREMFPGNCDQICAIGGKGRILNFLQGISKMGHKVGALHDRDGWSNLESAFPAEFNKIRNSGERFDFFIVSTMLWDLESTLALWPAPPGKFHIPKNVPRGDQEFVIGQVLPTLNFLAMCRFMNSERDLELNFHVVHDYDPGSQTIQDVALFNFLRVDESNEMSFNYEDYITELFQSQGKATFLSKDSFLEMALKRVNELSDEQRLSFVHGKDYVKVMAYYLKGSSFKSGSITLKDLYRNLRDEVLLKERGHYRIDECDAFIEIPCFRDIAKWLSNA